MQIATDGLVLRQVKVGEADQILTILTPDHGVLSASARGSLRLKSKLFSACGLFCYSEFTITAGRASYFVDTAAVKKVFHGLGRSVEAMALASYLAEAACVLAPEPPESAELLRLLLNSLYSRDFPAPVIILGDFNSQPVLDCSDLMTLVGKHDSQTIAAQGSLPVVMDAGSADSLSFYDPLLSADNAAGADGTYFHEGVFYDYDRILAGATVCRTYECSVEIVDSISPGGLCPAEYDPQTGEGLSDHFPVKLTLSAPAHDN